MTLPVGKVLTEMQALSVAFGMQSTKCLSAILLVFAASSALHSQDIQFDQGS